MALPFPTLLYFVPSPKLVQKLVILTQNEMTLLACSGFLSVLHPSQIEKTNNGNESLLDEQFYLDKVLEKIL